MLLREAIERVKGRVPYKMVGCHVGCMSPFPFLVSKVRQNEMDGSENSLQQEGAQGNENVETYRTTNSHTSSSSLIKDPPSMYSRINSCILR